MILSLIRLRPHSGRLMAWSVTRGYLPLRADKGYALHAITRAALGDFAPRPFILKETRAGVELLGYVPASAAAVTAVATLPPIHDPEAATALALETLEARAMPAEWLRGQMLGFELRARPIVRVRSGGRDGPKTEVDVALHARTRDPASSDELVYRDWLMNRLKEKDAAALLDVRIEGRASTQVLRRGGKAPDRRSCLVPGPDVLFRGVLRVANPEAFAHLLARGVGRHAAFGFGCLLLAPPGTV
jgi:CRISPR system Cascade subunit CasE